MIAEASPAEVGAIISFFVLVTVWVRAARTRRDRGEKPWWG